MGYDMFFREPTFRNLYKQHIKTKKSAQLYFNMILGRYPVAQYIVFRLNIYNVHFLQSLNQKCDGSQ